MYIEVTKNNGTDYLRLVRSVRVTNSKGIKTATKKVVFNIGPLKRFDDGKPDYVYRLKESYKNGTPLIPELLPYVEKNEIQKYTIEFTSESQYCVASPKRFASCILNPVFSALGLDSLFATIKHSSKIKYDLCGIVRLLTFGRILEPASKIATMKQNSSYYQPLVNSNNNDNVYDTLDVIYENRKKIIKRMNGCITRNIGRKTDTIFYDVTNFFFEIEHPDKDETNEVGNITKKGLRKMGVSKENRKQPIVQAGLFLDNNGIPISVEIFPGNTLDHLTFCDAMKNTIDNLGLERFILIADRGMYNGTNMCHVLDQGHGYIVSKSLKKSTKKDREWTIETDGYTVVNSDFKYKSRIVSRKVKDENGNMREIKEKVVVYWSKAFCERERHENRSFLDFVEKLKNAPCRFRVTATQSKSLKKFLKKETINKDTGEILDSKKLVSMIDDKKVNEFTELMGFYQIVSSELEMDALEIIDKYHGLTRIEDQFREMKGTLDTRPFFVNTAEHIHAHLIVCFVALTMMRIIQYKIKKYLPEDKFQDLDWSYGMPGNRLSKALLNWQVEQLSDEYFRMVNTINSEDMKLILKAFNISIPLKLFTKMELRDICSNIEVF